MTSASAHAPISTGLAAGRQPSSSSILTMQTALEGAAGLAVYRDAVAETTDIAPLEAAEDFRAHALVHHLGSAVLTDVRTSSVTYTRSARHVAHAAYDHYQIAVNLTTDGLYEFGRQSQPQRPGDVIILDSARSHRSYLKVPAHGWTSVPSVFIPRAAIASLLPVWRCDEHLLVLRREQPEAILLRDHLDHMLKTLAAEPGASLGAAVGDLNGVLARVLSAGGDLSPLAREGLRHAALESLKRLVERHLDSPVLSTDSICARSGWSRATVYRLFEAEGGLARYIRERHLLRAFRELMSARAPYRRIVDVALAHQFSSEATFNRAFRREFGIPPGEVRNLAARSRAAAPADPPVGAGRESQAVRWIMRLGTGEVGPPARP